MPQECIVTGQDWNKVIFHSRKPESAKTLELVKKPVEDDLPLTKVTATQRLSLAKCRIAAGYKSQKDLAAATRGKISAARINELENGKATMPSGSEKQILFKLIKMKF